MARDMIITTPRELGLALRDRRKALGLDQVELAKLIGASRRWVIDAENGKSASLPFLLRALRALKMQMKFSADDELPRSTQQPLPAIDLDDVIARARRSTP